LDPAGVPKGRRIRSALEIAIKDGNHSLCQLLLCNGYRLEIEPEPPLNLALRTRRWNLVDMLLAWEADPQSVDLTTLFDTYNRSLIERFRDAGVDLTDGHELASALAYHPGNKPLIGFVKRHLDLIVRRGRIEIEQRLDVSTHERSPLSPGATPAPG
jgi:hypothetical protein